jgi:hypothetical protein
MLYETDTTIAGIAMNIFIYNLLRKAQLRIVPEYGYEREMNFYLFIFSLQRPSALRTGSRAKPEEKSSTLEMVVIKKDRFKLDG